MLFRVRGVPVRAHWTLLLILPYLAVVLSIQLRSVAEFAGVQHEQLAMPPLLWGAVLALGLFASIALHELAHSAAAIRFGGSVRSITLMLVGGVSQLAREPSRPRHEAITAAVGPLTSFALGALLYLARVSGPWPADLRMALFYLTAMNLSLAIFNLIPAFPLDGGRVLRAVLSAQIGRERATRTAVAIGKACAIALGLFGLVSVNPLLILVAIIVYTGADSEVVEDSVRSALEGLRIVDLVPPQRRLPPVVSSALRLEAVPPVMRDLDRLEVIAVDPAGAPLAVIGAGDLDVIPPAEQSATTVGDLAERLAGRHVVVSWDVSANDAIALTTETEAAYAIVTDPRAARPGDLIGVVAAEDISRMVKLQLLARRPPRTTSLARAAR